MMQHYPVELGRVVYNPANRAFETQATVHTQTGTHSYACAFQAPIDTSFAAASEGLTLQALRVHARDGSGKTQSVIDMLRRALPQNTSGQSRINWRWRARNLVF